MWMMTWQARSTGPPLSAWRIERSHVRRCTLTQASRVYSADDDVAGKIHRTLQ
jgi:hypothetical protein